MKSKALQLQCEYLSRHLPSALCSEVPIQIPHPDVLWWFLMSNCISLVLSFMLMSTAFHLVLPHSSSDISAVFSHPYF